MAPELDDLLQAQRSVRSLHGVLREWVDYESLYEASGEPPDRPRGTSVLHREVWVVPPDRARQEADGHAAGRNGDRWWQLYPDGTLERGERGSGFELVIARLAHEMLEPQPTLELLELSVLDTGAVAGHPSLQLRAVAREGVDPLDGRLQWLGFYADHWLLELDAERGVLLAVEAMHRERSLSSVTFTSIGYDEPIPDELFEAPVP